MKQPRDFDRLGDHLPVGGPPPDPASASDQARPRHRARLRCALRCIDRREPAGQGPAGDRRQLRSRRGGHGRRRPVRRVIERDTGAEGAWVGEPEIRSGGDRFEEFLRWQRLMDEVLIASGTEPLPANVCTEEELTDFEVITIQTYVDQGFRPGEDKASLKAHMAVERALGATEGAPCRGYGFAHSQVDLVFRGAAPPSDLFAGARAAYEEAKAE
jgi:hypothetical protein